MEIQIQKTLLKKNTSRPVRPIVFIVKVADYTCLDLLRGRGFRTAEKRDYNLYPVKLLVHFFSVPGASFPNFIFYWFGFWPVHTDQLRPLECIH